MPIKKEYKLLLGSRAQVMHGTAKKTSGGLRKKDLKYNKYGKIISKCASKSAKKCNNLVNAGYVTQKGSFGVIKKNQKGGDNIFYILFVRHCHACHNIKGKGFGKIIEKVKAHRNESYCTNKGLKQSFMFGKKLKLIEEKIKIEIPFFKNSKKIKLKFFSSYLQRAIITSYMIQLGYYGDNNSDIKLNVIDGLTEIKGEKLDDIIELQKPNYITRERFNLFKKFFLKTTKKNINEVKKDSGINFDPKQTTKDNIENNFKYFLNILGEQINNNNDILPVVVGHSQYIQHILNLANKLDNLDAVLIPINKDGSELTFNKKSLKFIKLQDILKSNISNQIELKNILNKRNNVNKNIKINKTNEIIIDEFEKNIKCGIKINNTPKFYNIAKQAVEKEKKKSLENELITFKGIKITPGVLKSSNIRVFKLIRFNHDYYLQYFDPNNLNKPIGCAFLNHNTIFRIYFSEEKVIKIELKNMKTDIKNNNNVKKLCPSIIFSKNKKNKKYISDKTTLEIKNIENLNFKEFEKNFYQITNN